MGRVLILVWKAIALAVVALTAATGVALFYPDLFPQVAALCLPLGGALPVCVFLFCAAGLLAGAVLRPIGRAEFRWKRMPFQILLALFVLIPVLLIETMLAWQAYKTPANSTVGLLAIPGAVTWLTVLGRWARNESDDERFVRWAPELPDNVMLANLTMVGLQMIGMLFYLVYPIVVVIGYSYLKSILFDRVAPTLADLQALVLPGPAGWSSLYPDIAIYFGCLGFLLLVALASAWRERDRGPGPKRFDR